MPSPQRILLLSFFPVTILLVAALALCLAATGARTAGVDTVGASGGYTQEMFNKVLEIWGPPPELKGNFQVQIEVALDATGRVVNCTPVRPSGMKVLDSSACDAVYQIGNFGKTPSDTALEVHLSFWTGMARGKVQTAPHDVWSKLWGTDDKDVHSSHSGETVAQALSQAQKPPGDKPDLRVVYFEQVLLALRPYWSFVSVSRQNLSCIVRVRVDMQGKVQQAVVSQSSGNRQFDASTVNAIIRTSQRGDFPAPPSAKYCDLDLVFTLNELMGR